MDQCIPYYYHSFERVPIGWSIWTPTRLDASLLRYRQWSPRRAHCVEYCDVEADEFLLSSLPLSCEDVQI